MCNDCFENEITAFSSEKAWLAFDKELSKKLSAKQLKFLGYKEDEGHIYGSLSCNQMWKLQDPDYSFRGYFKRL